MVGTLETPTDPKVKSILKNLKRSFETFKEDKEVRDNMTRKEEIIAETRAETRAEEAEKYALIIAEQAEQIVGLEEKISKQAEQSAKQAEQSAKQAEQNAKLAEQSAKQGVQIAELVKTIKKLELRLT